AGPTDAGRHGTFLEILFDWVQGRTLREMADQHLAGVSRPGARLEKLVDLIGGHFELFLPWALNAVVAQTNEIVKPDPELTPEETNKYSDYLAAYVRWGVNNQTSLELILRGVLSRRLAMIIA